jgi:hypothetical protein
MKPTIETVVYAAVTVSYVSPVAAEHVDCAIVTIMASERLRFVLLLYRSYYLCIIVVGQKHGLKTWENESEHLCNIFALCFYSWCHL